jgi:hypothetical protein
MQVSNWIALASLIVAIITLCYLIEYVKATKTIARQSVEQVEATFRPAVVVVPGTRESDSPRIVNIGKGIALGVTWSMAKNADLRGRFAYLRTEGESLSLGFHGKYLQEDPTALISCQYTSISGRRYASVNQFDAPLNVFTTSFDPITQA